MTRHVQRRRRGTRRSSASGGSSTAQSLTACKKPATGSSPSPDYHLVSGAVLAPPMPSSGCTRNSSDGSRRKPCCHRRIPQPCCSGRCSLPVRSTCARSMVGTHLQPNSSINRSTSPHDRDVQKRGYSDIAAHSKNSPAGFLKPRLLDQKAI